MKLTIFAKKRRTKDGKPFYTYLTRLKKKNGEEDVVSVKFTDDFKPSPNDCPLNIEVDKEKANLSVKTVIVNDEDYLSKTLWVKEYKTSDEVYVDRSLDDYE